MLSEEEILWAATGWFTEVIVVQTTRSLEVEKKMGVGQEYILEENGVGAWTGVHTISLEGYLVSFYASF